MVLLKVLVKGVFKQRRSPSINSCTALQSHVSIKRVEMFMIGSIIRPVE